MKKITGVRAVLALLLAGSVATAQATLVRVTDTAAMTQGDYVVEDFNDRQLVSGADWSDVRIFGSGGGVERSGWGALPSGSPSRDITIRFDQDISSFGLWFGNDDGSVETGFDAFITAFDGDRVLGTVSLAANMNDTNDQFIGFISEAKIDRILFGYTTRRIARAFDDLMFNGWSPEYRLPRINTPGALPEAGTAWLFGMGAFAFVSMRRRALRC